MKAIHFLVSLEALFGGLVQDIIKQEVLILMVHQILIASRNKISILILL